MVEYENECLGCDNGCIGYACPNRKAPHYYCDECGEEETLYKYDGEELCIECIKMRLEVVNP